MARQWIDIRSLPENKAAFEALRDFMLNLNGNQPVKLSWYTGQYMNPWSVAEEDFTVPLCYQASKSHLDSKHYPSSKKVMANILVKQFLPTAGYTLDKFVETKPQSFWIKVNELEEVVFRVFTFRGGGIGVSTATLLGQYGMLDAIRCSDELIREKEQKDALKRAAASKLTAEERKALGL